MANKARQECIETIKTITSKYNWDYRDTAKLEEALKNYGRAEYNSALPHKDAQIINELEEFVKGQAWKLTFNHDREDGFWIEVERGYTQHVADLNDLAKRSSLLDAINAALDFFKVKGGKGVK